ncbi:MAG: hypothetical protein EBU90_30720, partial [Proteobacteria bacterium]|nr:hypothetical protein [Pseudomonadota bacterium]
MNNSTLGSVQLSVIYNNLRFVALPNTGEALVEIPENANKFGNAIIAGTTNYPTNAMLSSQYLFTTGTTSNRDNTSNNDYTTTVTTYTSTAYSNISSGGKGSIFSDSSFQVIRSTNAINGSSGYDCPIDATAVFDISRLFSGITDRQRQYGIKVSFWVKTTYSSSKPNVSPEINLFVTADIPNSNSTTAPRVSGSKTEMSTVKVNAAKWTQINLDITPEILLSSTIIRYLRLNIRSESFLDSFPEIAIDDVQIFRVSKRQSKKVDNYNNVSALFSTNRPGEYLVRYDEDGFNVQEGQSCHGTPIDVGFGVGTQADFDISKVALYDDNYISNNNFSSYITSTWD